MSDIAIRVENLTKEYRLGVINHGTLRQDMESWWAKLRGKDDPNSVLGARQDLPGQKFLALNDVSFTVMQGEMLGIIGRNGAGKSTLLKILSRITAPSKGEIRLRGRVASLLEVGTGFHPELTGRENIFLNGAILGMSRCEINAKFDEIVDFSEIEEFIDTPVKRYSSGMYVRLAFAVAAHLEPEILLVDEVLAVGDAQFQKKCLGKMGDVGNEGRTVLYVSHNMPSILSLCTRLIWLGNGVLIEDGDPVITSHAYLSSMNTVLPNASMDLMEWSHRYGNEESRIIAARLLDFEEKVCAKFHRNDALTVEFVFSGGSRHQLHFSATIVSETGIRVVHLSHHDDRDFISGVFQGEFAVRFTIPHLPLCAGNYKFVLAIHSSHLVPIDVVTDVLPFIAEDSPVTPRPYRTVAEYAYCWTPNSWSIEKMGR